MSSIRELPLPYVLDSTSRGPVRLVAVTDRLVLRGISNCGRSAQEWADEIAALDDGAFTGAAAEAVYWSAWASNNPTSDYHYQATACYYEALRRENPDLYQQAYDKARERAGL